MTFEASTSMRKAASACLKGFSTLVTVLEAADKEHRLSMPPDRIDREHGRFNIWCGNLGALQSGKSSLDFRLQDSAVMQSNVGKLLNKLHVILQKSIQVASGARLPLERMPVPEGAGDEFSGDDCSDESEGEGDENPDDEPVTELGQHLLTVCEILTDLYKLSFKIRNSATRPKSTRPGLYKEIDEETGVDKFDTFAVFDRQYVEESFKQLCMESAIVESKASSQSSAKRERAMCLVDRLAKTITKRRRMLRYWQRHSEKLGSVPKPTNEGENPFIHANLRQPILGALDTVVDLQKPKLVDKLIAPSFIDQTIFSGTEASKYDSKYDGELDSRSAISYMSEAFDMDGNVVALPPPPAQALTGDEFLCPYCGIVCPSRHAQRPVWRTHVLQDLQPYVCTEPKCDDSTQMYSSRRLWLEHERLVHRKVWQCFEHSGKMFASSAELYDHLKLEHRGEVTETQIKSLLEVSGSTIADTRTSCPICLAEGPFPKGLENHISFHLENFAIFSIPRGILSDDTESDGEEEQGKRDAGSNDWAKSVSLDFQSPPISNAPSITVGPMNQHTDSKSDQVASFTFRIHVDANEVFVSGTFNDWGMTVKLEKRTMLDKKGFVFENTVELPLNEKILYKFVVDGNWVTLPTYPIGTDKTGNTFNVLDTTRVAIAPFWDDWVVTPREKAQYDRIFNKFNTAETEYVLGRDIRNFLEESGVPVEILAEIWNLTDLDKSGKLNRDQFAMTMFLVRQQRIKPAPALPVKLPINYVAPSERMRSDSFESGAAQWDPPSAPWKTDIEDISGLHVLDPWPTNLAGDILGETLGETNSHDILEKLLQDLTPSEDKTYRCSDIQPEGHSCDFAAEQKVELREHLESILKTNTCRHGDCNGKEFFSSALLFSHEKEFHGMHGRHPPENLEDGDVDQRKATETVREKGEEELFYLQAGREAASAARSSSRKE